MRILVGCAAPLQAPCGFDRFSYSWRDKDGFKFHNSRGSPYSQVRSCLFSTPLHSTPLHSTHTLVPKRLQRFRKGMALEMCSGLPFISRSARQHVFFQCKHSAHTRYAAPRSCCALFVCIPKANMHVSKLCPVCV